MPGLRRRASRAGSACPCSRSCGRRPARSRRSVATWVPPQGCRSMPFHVDQPDPALAARRLDPHGPHQLRLLGQRLVADPARRHRKVPRDERVELVLDGRLLQLGIDIEVEPPLLRRELPRRSPARRRRRSAGAGTCACACGGSGAPSPASATTRLPGAGAVPHRGRSDGGRRRRPRPCACRSTCERGAVARAEHPDIARLAAARRDRRPCGRAAPFAGVYRADASPRRSGRRGRRGTAAQSAASGASSSQGGTGSSRSRRNAALKSLLK